ncbi:MAG: phosphatase PAP2 family protein [Lachnospiraceae bacterium]
MTKKERRHFIPKYSLLPLLITVIWNQVVYCGSMLLTRNWTHYSFELPMDRIIPFLPWTVSVYFGCYLFWITNYILCSRQEKSEAYRFLCADFLSKTVCLVCFLLIPTTNIRPSIEGDTLWTDLMRFLYQVDSPSNLFPSIHCLVSWLSYIGIRGKKHIPVWYRLFSCLMALAVFLSTLTTKQHVIVDVIGGVLLAEICYRAAGWRPILRAYTHVMERFTEHLTKV